MCLGQSLLATTAAGVSTLPSGSGGLPWPRSWRRWGRCCPVVLSVMNFQIGCSAIRPARSRPIARPAGPSGQRGLLFDYLVADGATSAESLRKAARHLNIMVET